LPASDQFQVWRAAAVSASRSTADGAAIQQGPSCAPTSAGANSNGAS
jgi:hypothetical protein